MNSGREGDSFIIGFYPRKGKITVEDLLLHTSGLTADNAIADYADGKVKAIELRPHPTGKKLPAIVIATDPYASQRWEPVQRNLAAVGKPEVVRAVQEAGLVGLGGAAFPSHVKLQVPEGKKVRFVVLNGCECEPYLTCDHRMMVERPDAFELSVGAAFAFGWTPCIGPVLAGILALTAVSTDGAGIGLLGAYSLGLGLPFLATAPEMYSTRG